MYQNKEVKVVLSEEATEVYEELQKQVSEELKRGIESSFHQTLLRSIHRAKDLLKENPFAGDQVRKLRIPRKYEENLYNHRKSSRNYCLCLRHC